MLVSNKEKKQRRLALLAAVCTLLAGAAVGLIATWGGVALPEGLTYLLVIAVAAIAMAATLPWWRSLDPMQRDGQYLGWYWGGSLGGMVVLLAIGVWAGLQSEMMKGAILMLGGQTAGFMLFGIAWRLRHGGRSS